MGGRLYDEGALLWSEQQSALLRRLVVGEAVNAAVDWESVAKETEMTGRSELAVCRSLLGQSGRRLGRARAMICPQSAAAIADAGLPPG